MSTIKDCGQAWFKNGKYGLFIHFGLYSLLGGRCHGKPVPGYSEWIMNNTDIPLPEYAAYAKQFNPEAFDAAEICRNAKRWGMRYLCFTAKHHDGYALFDSACSGYNSVKQSACHRDFVAELAAACQAESLPLCLYYSQAQDWAHPDGYRAYHENGGKNFRRYLDEKCLPQIRELLTNYGPVAMLWFDTPMGMTAEESQEIYDLVKRLQPSCLVSGRIGHRLGDYLTTQDNRLPALPTRGDWELPATLNHSWGFSLDDHDWRSADDVLTALLKVVSRGGNFLLNIGPDGQGRTPEAGVKILDAVGDWLAQNGESVYGAHAVSPYVYETPELLFTHRPHALYLHVLRPERLAGREIPLPNISNTVRRAAWLNDGNPIDLDCGQTLEGDPYWGLQVPNLPSAPPLVLTAKVETEEADFLLCPLDI